MGRVWVLSAGGAHFGWSASGFRNPSRRPHQGQRNRHNDYLNGIGLGLEKCGLGQNMDFKMNIEINIILVLGCGILMSIENFLDVLNQQVLVGIILVGRL